MLRAVKEHGYTEPTSIQSEAIPVVLSGKDILAGAQTGTGKTAGFTLPMLDRLMDGAPAALEAAQALFRSQSQGQNQQGRQDGRGQRDARGRGRQDNRGPRRVIRALVLTPTRELAAQVAESIRTYGKYMPFRSTCIYGGVNISPQFAALRAGVDIVIATPGRLLDHVGQGTIDLSKVEILVLDEADRMLDMGFLPDIKRVMDLLPVQRQTLLFSATFSSDIKKLADELLKSPVHIQVSPQNTTVEAIAQIIHPVDRKRKREMLSYLIGSQQWKQVLVFCRTKAGANRLAEQLVDDGITADAIHGNKSQGARTRALADFKRGKVSVLVATDIAARGLDIDQLPHVVNFELPNVPEDYIHRIGRTGRAGKEGRAVSLVCVDERGFLRSIERLINRQIDTEVIPGFEPDPRIRAEAIILGGGYKQGGHPRPRHQHNGMGHDSRPRQGGYRGGQGGGQGGGGYGGGNGQGGQGTQGQGGGYGRQGAAGAGQGARPIGYGAQGNGSTGGQRSGGGQGGYSQGGGHGHTQGTPARSGGGVGYRSGDSGGGNGGGYGGGAGAPGGFKGKRPRAGAGGGYGGGGKGRQGR